MTLSFSAAQTAGATVLLVTTPIPKDQQRAITRRLLSLRELPAQRVAYLTFPSFRRPARLDCGSDGFSGSACACAGLLCAAAQGFRREKAFSLSIEGMSAPCQVHANPLTGQVSLALPLPGRVTRETLEGHPLSLLSFPGVVHVVSASDPLPSRAALPALLAALGQKQEVSTLQWTHWDPGRQTLTSFRLHQDGSLTEEPGSLSGFAAAALSAARGEGTHKLEWPHPNGAVRAAVTVHHGAVSRLTLTTTVLPGKQYDLSF